MANAVLAWIARLAIFLPNLVGSVEANPAPKQTLVSACDRNRLWQNAIHHVGLWLSHSMRAQLQDGPQAWLKLYRFSVRNAPSAQVTNSVESMTFTVLASRAISTMTHSERMPSLSCNGQRCTVLWVLESGWGSALCQPAQQASAPFPLKSLPFFFNGHHAADASHSGSRS